MELFIHVLSVEVKNFYENNICLRVIGDRSRFSERLQDQKIQGMPVFISSSGSVLNIAANYGGRWDIAQAAQTLALQVQQGTLLRILPKRSLPRC